MLIREEDVGMYRCVKRQRNAVTLTTDMTDQIELRENQSEMLYTTAFKNLLATSGDADQEFVLSEIGGGSSAGSIIINKKAIGNGGGGDGAGNDGGTGSAESSAAKNVEQNIDEDKESDMSSGLLWAFGATPSQTTTRASKAKAKPKPKSAPSSQGTPSGAPSEPPPRSDPVPRSDPALRSDPPRRAVLGELKNIQANAGKRPIPATAVEGSDEPRKWELPELPATKRGRVSATDLQNVDDRFVEELEKVIVIISESSLPETSDGDLHQYVKDAATKTREIISKCSTKLTQMKRRKNADNDSLADRLKDVNNNANLFTRLFTELGSTAPKAGELGFVMNQLSSPPLSFRSLF